MLKRFAKKWKGDEDSWAQATLDIGMYFTTGGDIKGSLGFKYVDGKCEVDASASKIGGGVDFNVEVTSKRRRAPAGTSGSKRRARDRLDWGPGKTRTRSRAGWKRT